MGSSRNRILLTRSSLAFPKHKLGDTNRLLKFIVVLAIRFGSINIVEAETVFLRGIGD